MKWASSASLLLASPLFAGSLTGTVKILNKDGKFRDPVKDVIAILEPLNAPRPKVAPAYVPAPTVVYRQTYVVPTYGYPQPVYSYPAPTYSYSQPYYGGGYVSRGPTFGNAMGAAVGGLIGSQIGHGSGNAAATAAGAVLGFMLGGQ